MLFLKLNAYFFLGVMAQYFIATYFFDKDRGASSAGVTGLLITALIVFIVTAIYYAVGYYGASRTNYLIMGVFLIILMINFLGLIVILYQSFISDAAKYRATVAWLTSFGINC